MDDFPKYMKTVPKKETKDNQKVQKDRKQTVDLIEKMIKRELFLSRDTMQVVETAASWIGGGKAWLNWKNNNSIPVSEDDEIAFTPANYDMFTMVNNAEQAKNILCKVFSDLVKLFKNAYKTEKGNRSRLFFGKHKAVLSWSPNIKTPNDNEFVFDFENEWTWEECMTKDFDDPHELTGILGYNGYELWLDADGKNLFYYAVFVCPNVNILDFANTYLMRDSDGTIYWNPNGLYMSQIMTSPQVREERIASKGFDVDKKRFKYLPPEVIKDAPALYKNVFYHSRNTNNFYKGYHFEELWLNSLSADQNEISKKIIKNTDILITAYFRSSLNAILVVLNFILERMFTGAYCFILGGDSMRRYNYDISPTNDIDMKIYYKDPSQFSQIESIVKGVLAISTEYLIQNINRILPETFPNKHGINLINTDPNRVQFRPRYSRSMGETVINLHSIDYRYFIQMPLGDGTTIENYHSLAILDITINEDSRGKLRNTRSIGVRAVTMDNQHFLDPAMTQGLLMNIASKEWLLSDLTYVYTNKELANRRQVGGKMDKDIRRFKELKKVIHHGNTNKQAKCLDIVNLTLLYGLLGGNAFLKDSFMNAYTIFFVWNNAINKSRKYADDSNNPHLTKGRISFNKLETTKNQTMFDEFKITLDKLVQIGQHYHLDEYTLKIVDGNVHEFIDECASSSILS